VADVSLHLCDRGAGVNRMIGVNTASVEAARPDAQCGDCWACRPLRNDVWMELRASDCSNPLVATSLPFVCLQCGFVFSGDTQYVKRIVAVPGDVVRYSTCSIFVTTGTGQVVKDAEPTMACRDRGEFKQIVLPRGCISSPVTIVGIASIREFLAQ
jgi:hypothetical protein